MKNLFSKENLAFSSILSIQFIGSLGISFVIPFLVVLVTRYGGNAFVYGVVGSLYPFFQLLGAPLLGKWSDRIGRKPALLVSQLGTLVAWSIFLLALYLPTRTLLEVDHAIMGIFFISLPLVVIGFARSLDGLTGGNISIAQAYMADISTKENRNKNFGYLGIASGGAFILGPALAGILSGTNLQEKLPVMAAVAISLVATLLIIFFLPESKATNKKKEKIRLRDSLACGGIPYMLVLNFLMFIAFNTFFASFPVHATTTLGWSVGQMGLYFSFLSLCMALVQGPVLGYVSKRFSETTLIVTGLLLLSSSFVAMISANIIFLLIAAILYAVGNGIMWPSFLSLLSKVAPENLQGSVQGLSGSAGSLASIVGLLIGGFMYDKLQFQTFTLSAIGMFIVTLLALRLRTIKQYSD